MKPGHLGPRHRRSRIDRSLVVDHRARDRDPSISGVQDLDEPALAGPVDQRPGGDLPEAHAHAFAVRVLVDRVHVHVPVQPQDHVSESVQQPQ